MCEHIAAYFRLSRDDDDKGDESNSIKTQRSIIKTHIDQMKEFNEIRLTEFTDDGYSGTNFDRPGVKRMLEAINNGEISCVIVKDFSRFGRSYLEVSKYIEVVFPYMGVRFISVNDCYDSDSHKGSAADIDVAFRNLMNAMYSRDISQKVKSAKLTKIRQGSNVNAFAPFGYKKNSDGGRLEIDEPAAAIVKRIYDAFCEGRAPTEIARELNAQGILTPSEYKKKNGCKLKMSTVSAPLWSSGIVNNILRNEQYLGTLICGKSEVSRLGSDKVVYKPKEAWTKIHNAHPAIITSETWELVSSKKSGAVCSNRKKPDTKRFLYKKIRCGHCGHIMRYRAEEKKDGAGKYRYYYCETHGSTGERCCSGETYSPQDIDETVRQAVIFRIAVMLDSERIYRSAKSSLMKNIEERMKNVCRINAHIERLDTSKKTIYECYRLGKIDLNEYLCRRGEAENKITSKKAELAALLSDQKKMKAEINKIRRVLNSLLKRKAAVKLTDDIVNATVSGVYIFSKRRIEVRFKFNDELLPKDLKTTQ